MAGTGPTVTVTGYTAEHMQQIEDSTLVGGQTTPEGHLLLVTRAGDQIDAGPLPASNVPGPPGPQGIPGDSSLPAGTINLWTGDADPPNWLICDGRAVSRNDYPSLFSAIGTKYGVGDGSTTFNIPNLKGTVPVGKDTTQTEFNALGKTGGEKTHLLTATEMPSHTHTQNSHTHTQNSHTHTQNSHTHTQNSHDHTASVSTSSSHFHGPSAGGSGFQAYTSGIAARASVALGSSGGFYVIGANGNINGIGYADNTTSDGAHTHTVNPSATTATNNSTTPPTSDATTATNNSATATNNNTGGGAAHNILQPYSVVNFIIKTTNGDTVGDSQLTQRVSALETTGAASAQAYVNDLIKGIELDGVTDLDTVTTPGVYTQSHTAEATTAMHYPQTIAGLLEVSSNTNNGGTGSMVWQTYTPYGSNDTVFYKRSWYTSTGWSAWQKYMPVPDTTPVLWSGASYMHGTQTATLSQKVSAQRNGIVLVWSRYDPSTSTTYDDTWSHTYVPKWHATGLPSGASQGIMTTFIDGAEATPRLYMKYVYVFDDHVSGNDMNDDPPANNRVLRYVLGN